MFDGKFEFHAICERGHRPLYSWDRADLRRRLTSAILPLRCGLCGAYREATPTEVAHLRLLLEESEVGRTPEAYAPAQMERITFSLPCPAGHTPSYTWNPRLLRRALASGELEVSCPRCQRPIEVSAEESARLRLLLEGRTPRGPYRIW